MKNRKYLTQCSKEL